MKSFVKCRGPGWGVEGSRLEAWMKSHKPEVAIAICRGVVWGIEGKQVGSMNEEPQVRGCYNITFICTPTNQETVYWKRHKQAKHLEHESKCKV